VTGFVTTGRPVTWVLADDKPGNLNPCLGLAETIGWPIVAKRIVPRRLWSGLPPTLWFAPLSAPGPGSDAITPPWPDLLIAAGRQTVAVSTEIRRRARGRSFAVQVLNPRVPLDRFDLVVAPRHDRINGPNVIVTVGAMNRVTPERLAAAAARFAPALAHLPRPRVAVLLGGDSRHHRLTPSDAAALGARLARLAGESGCGLMVTPSRRTGADNVAALRAALGTASAVVWDGTGENPFFAYLGLADHVLATEDSVAMVSEACSTGKPVQTLAVLGGGTRMTRFHDELRRDGLVRPFTGRLESWHYRPLAEAQRVAVEVRRRLGERAANGLAVARGSG